MQKALTQMNIQLANVISDLSGVTGQLIVRAIIAGERDPWKLAELRHPRIQASRAEIAKSLEGNWRPELIFVPQCSQTVQPRLSCRSSYDTVTLGPPTPLYAAPFARTTRPRRTNRPARPARSTRRQWPQRWPRPTRSCRTARRHRPRESRQLVLLHRLQSQRGRLPLRVLARHLRQLQL